MLHQLSHKFKVLHSSLDQNILIEQSFTVHWLLNALLALQSDSSTYLKSYVHYILVLYCNLKLLLY